MITVQILINGEVIYARTAVNKGKANKELSKYEVDTGETLLHDRNDGAVKLAKKLLETIKET